MTWIRQGCYTSMTYGSDRDVNTWITQIIQGCEHVDDTDHTGMLTPDNTGILTPGWHWSYRAVNTWMTYLPASCPHWDTSGTDSKGIASSDSCQCDSFCCPHRSIPFCFVRFFWRNLQSIKTIIWHVYHNFWYWLREEKYPVWVGIFSYKIYHGLCK